MSRDNHSSRAFSQSDTGQPETWRSRRPEGSPDLDRLFRAEALPLTRLAMRRAGSRDDALDVVQEAFARLLRLGRERAAEVERPAAYLNRVTANLLHDRAKKSARESQALHVTAEEVPLAGPDQLHLLETRDLLRRLENAMQQLKPKTRAIFLAHRIDGMSYAEIAEMTGLSIKGVEKQMSKAIAHLDRVLSR